MRLGRLAVDNFRNLARQTLELDAGLTVLVGPNGAGKTNLLEAVCVLGNLTSFRSGSPASWIRHGQQRAALAAEVERAGGSVPLEQGLRRVGARVARTLRRGARRLGSAEYLELFPVVALSATDRRLVFGPPEERRRFLDRLAFHLHFETLSVLQRYRRALAQRSTLLLRGAKAETLDAFEAELARQGARLVELRRQALAALGDLLPGELERLGWVAARPVLRYHAGDGSATEDGAAAARRLRASLLQSRGEDRRRGVTSVGPHRHELVITVQGIPARDALSAGQGKLLAVALRLAAMSVLERRRGEAPCVVFDDIDAELDSAVLRRVLGRLGGSERQVIASSAHAELLAEAEATVLEVRDGVVAR
ncbi:MAG: DNA replication and repair protein RecF [Thermoanaerobaculaceae bacterium]|nr:DNA replication and repair protein RecF [Thermoanaerobaculaceae bacterium]